MEVHSISHLYPLELSLTHDHVVPDNVDCSDLDVDIVQFNDDDLELDNEISEYSKNVDFAFNQQDIVDPKNNSNINVVDKEHSVSQDVVPYESEDIVSNDSQLNNLDTINPDSSRVIEVQLHPSGRPVRQVTGRGKPLDNQFLYEF